MLSEMWETYAQLSRRLPDKETSASLQKRQLLLDRFLVQFLHLSCTDASTSLCELRNVSNELSHEFMHNILSVTSTSADGDDITALEHYLLSGRGWMLLYTIHKTGVQGVYNRQDLCNILLTLLPFCLKFNNTDSVHSITDLIGIDPQTSVSQCFHLVDTTPKATKHTRFTSKHLSAAKKRGSPSAREKKHYRKTTSSKHKSGALESDAEDSDVKQQKQPRFKKSMRTQMWTTVSKEEESASEDDFGDNAITIDFTGKSIGSCHFFQLILRLLEDLCVLDVTVNSPSQCLSAVVLPVLLDVLNSYCAHGGVSGGYLQEEDAVPLPWTRDQALVVQQQLVRVVLTLSGIVATQQNGVRILLSLKIVPGILSSLTYCCDRDNKEDNVSSYTSLERNVIQDTVCGSLDLFRVVFNHLPFNPSFVRDASAMMELFRKHGGEAYFDALYMDSDQQQAEQRVGGGEGPDNPVRWLCSLMHSLKVVKVNYIHAIKCLKRRHRNCEYSFFFHHHHDIFGSPLDSVLFTNEESGNGRSKSLEPSVCQMAKWSQLLLECLKKARAKSSRLLILCALREEGVCCCLQPASIVNLLIPLLPSLSPAVKNYALETLNCMLLEQFGGEVEVVACSQCSSPIPHPPHMDSGFASELGEVSDKSQSRWRSLQLLKKYVLSPDDSIALSVSKHLITLAVRGNSSIREELFFGIYSCVLNMKNVDQPGVRGEREEMWTSSSSSEEGGEGSVRDSVLLLCVSSLPYVLQVDKVMRQFLDKDGLACLTRLLDSQQLRGPVMGVFEALIMIDEQTMVNRHASPHTANSQQSVEYKGGIIIQTFIDNLAKKTCAITVSFQQLQLEGSLSKSHTPSNSKEQSQEDGQDTSNTATEQNQDLNSDQNPDQKPGVSLGKIHKGILETVPALQDMWKTCAKLCMNSETFRICYRNSHCLYIVQETLVLALSILSEFTPAAVSASAARQCGREPLEATGKYPSSLVCHYSHLAFIESVMVVCFSCQTLLPLQPEGEEQEMLLRVKSTLEQCVELEPSKLRAVFDMLLNVAQPQLPSILEYSYAQITSTLSQQDVSELDDEDEVKKIAHHWSDDEFECLHTEQGYEADTETNLHQDWHKEIEGSVLGSGGGMAAARCFPAVLRLFVELLVASQDSSSGQAVLIPVLLRLLHMLQASHATATAACKQGVLELILKGFHKVLLQPAIQQQHSVLCEILMTTIQVLGQVEISSSELAFLFNFFLQTHNVNSVLSTLTSIAENSWVAPSTYLSFPICLRRWLPHRNHAVANDPSSGPGVWSVSTIQCAVKDLQWPPFDVGFSLTLWLSLESLSSCSSSQSSQAGPGNGDREGTTFVPPCEDCLHLTSLGDSTKMLEVWVHVPTTTLLLRLTSLKCNNSVLKETPVALDMSYLEWHNIVISYVDILDGSTSLGKLTVRVDGVVVRECVLDHPASVWHCPVSNATPSLHLGHCARHVIKPRLGHFNLGPVFLFADRNLSSEWWFHVFALGPTVGGLVKCDCGFPRINYAGLLHRDLLKHTALSHDVLVGTAPILDMEKALMSQVLYFDPLNWKTYCSYGAARDRSSSSSSSQLGLLPSSSSSDQLLGVCPVVQGSHVSGEMKVMCHVNLPQALEQLGGVQALLFLVAKVFEQSEDDDDSKGKRAGVQSKAVHLLLTFLHRFPPLTVTFTQMQGYHMLALVLRSSPSPVGCSLIKVLFDAATSESIFKVEGTSGRLLLRTSSESVMVNVGVVTDLLLCWQVWQTGGDHWMELILSALVLLVRPDHPYRTFNVKQLQAAGVVKLLFHMYLERIQEGMPALSKRCGLHVAAIVSSVVGQPPDLALLASLTDFLLQLHPPTTRFINYTPSAFYLHPLWLTEEEERSDVGRERPRKSGGTRGEKGTTVQLVADKDEEMERVQFRSGHGGAGEGCWDSLAGSDDSDDDFNADGLSTNSPVYPQLEAAPNTATRSFCLGNSLDESNEASSDENTSSHKDHQRSHEHKQTDIEDSKTTVNSNVPQQGTDSSHESCESQQEGDVEDSSSTTVVSSLLQTKQGDTEGTSTTTNTSNLTPKVQTLDGTSKREDENLETARDKSLENNQEILYSVSANIAEENKFTEKTNSKSSSVHRRPLVTESQEEIGQNRTELDRQDQSGQEMQLDSQQHTEQRQEQTEGDRKKQDKQGERDFDSQGNTLRHEQRETGLQEIGLVGQGKNGQEETGQDKSEQTGQEKTGMSDEGKTKQKETRQREAETDGQIEARENKTEQTGENKPEKTGPERQKKTRRPEDRRPDVQSETKQEETRENDSEASPSQKEVVNSESEKRSESPPPPVQTADTVAADTAGLEEGLETLCLSLLQYLLKVVLEQPQQNMNEVFCQVINPHALLVLAQSSSAAIRIAVTEVLSAYLWRCPGERLEEFVREDGLFLLANQLSAFPVCQQLVEISFSLLMQHSFTFHDQWQVGELSQVNELQQVAPVLVLSLLCGTLHDLPLCHNTLTVLAQIIENSGVISQVFIDLGLPETLCNLLYKAQRHHYSVTDVEGMSSEELILLDIQKIFCLLAVSQFRWGGMIHYQQVEAMFTVLQALEDKEKTRGESGQKRGETARALQSAMVVSVLDCVQRLSQDMARMTTSWLSSQSTGSLTSPAATQRSFSVAYSIPPSSSLHPHPSYLMLKPSLPGASISRTPFLRTVHSLPHITVTAASSSPIAEDRRLGEGSHPGLMRWSSEEGKPSLLQRLFSRKKRLEYSCVNQSELLDRFKKFLVMAVDLAVYKDREKKKKPQTQHTLIFLTELTNASLDDRFIKYLFTTVYQSLALTLSKDQYHKRTRNAIMLSAKDVLRVQFGRLLTCMLSPRMDFDQRIFTVSYLMGDSMGRDVVRLLAAAQHVSTELGLHIHDLLSEWRDWLNPNQRDLVLTLLTVLRQCGCNVTSPDMGVSADQADILRQYKRAIEARHVRDQDSWKAKRSSQQERVCVRFEEVLERVQGHGMELTQRMTAQQVRERGSLVEHIKHTMAQQVHLKKNWQDIVHSLTHERAVWHHAESYPQSWELDPTEGPGRIRRRLMRCHLGLQAKYLLPTHRHKLESQEKDPPLKYLFEDHHQVADSATLVYKLFTNDTVHNTFVCTSVLPSSESRGELLLGEQYLYFVADKAITDTDYTQMLLGNKDQLSLMWRYTELNEVHCRWYQLKDTALEMFVVTGRSHLLAFNSTAERDQVVGLLQSQLDEPRVGEQTVAHVQRAWLEGSMTNFDYLTFLNKLAGRSFNDLMQYPVFPFILRDYDSEELNLENAQSFRDLRKPIAVQDKSRERKYMDNYEFLQQEMLKPGPEEVMRVAPFHYGSHYSNSGTVLHYLVRLPPFTRMFLAYQDRSFDIPDRTFHSMRTSWRLSSFDSTTDVKELIPEFFFLPEFLTNAEGYEFGCRQNGEAVDSVQLPAWCGGDPRLFVLIHRQALESTIATAMLHHWLDLVFGFKQTGEEAVKAINVFHPSTYFGMDVSSVNDPLKRQALLTMIRTYGQTPKQLFAIPHPSADLSQSTLPITPLEKRTYVPRPVSTVNGLRWGRYVGSPDMPQPSWQRITQLPVAITSMVALVTGPVFGIEDNSTLITLHTKPTGTAYKQTDVLWAGLVTWEHPDSVLRVVSHSRKPLVNFMPPNPYDKVRCCAAALDRCLLFVAGASGNISVFNMTHNVAKPSTLHVWGLRRMLCGHQGAITVLQVCKAFGVVVSGSQDSTVIIWDLNRLSYVRTVARHRGEVVAVAVSNTLGDVASICHLGRTGSAGSELLVSTINGSRVGRYTCEARITCLAYSSAPEGRAINIIAGGLHNGTIRLWSSWDVSHLRDLSDDPGITRPILSVAFTNNSQALFVSLADGTIVMWHTDHTTLSSNAALFMPVLRHHANTRN